MFEVVFKQSKSCVFLPKLAINFLCQCVSCSQRKTSQMTRIPSQGGWYHLQHSLSDKVSSLWCGKMSGLMTRPGPLWFGPGTILHASCGYRVHFNEWLEKNLYKSYFLTYHTPPIKKYWLRFLWTGKHNVIILILKSNWSRSEGCLKAKRLLRQI